MSFKKIVSKNLVTQVLVIKIILVTKSLAVIL